MKKTIATTRVIAMLALVVLLLPAARPAAADQHHIEAALLPVAGSGVTGFVNLVQRPQEAGTRITVVAFGMSPGSTHLSLYYENSTCEIEPYDPGDIIGGQYTANAAGIGVTHGQVDDNLDDINSVSVRDAPTFNLLACANIHPGP
jgi:hypothetical protein